MFHVTDIDIINTTVTTMIGVVNTTSSIQFGCQASGVPMVTDISWTYPPHVTFGKQLQFSSDNSSLIASGDVVGRIEFSHTGWYRCTATNDVTSNSILFRLIVKGKYCVCTLSMVNTRCYLYVFICGYTFTVIKLGCLFLLNLAVPGFLELLLSANFCMLCVCPPRLLVTSGVMWRDMDSI